jgi:hypothetical protein
MKGVSLLAVCLLPLAASHAAELAPPRLFFSDAKLSFLVPEPWDVPSSFPFGPLLTRKTQEGTDAFILCQISDPIDPSRLSADVSIDNLKTFATNDISSRTKNSRILASSARTLAGQNAYEVTWLSEGPEGVMQYQSVYFFMESRYYVLSLRANRDSFPWIVQDFQNWLTSVRLLTRQDSGKLDTPAHGAMWVHQTGGAKIAFPEEWLVGVADDRQVGATIARDKVHLDFTATVEVLGAAAKDVTAEEKTAARHALEQKGYAITAESDEPFHGLPCNRLIYEGTIDGRFIRGQDLWVASPRARWLISLEGDGAFFRQLTDQWQGILNGIHFYE